MSLKSQSTEKNLKNVTVIIPTAGEMSRLESLESAIQSALAQSGVNVTPLVMLNGCIHQKETYEKLSSDSRIRFFYDPKPSLPNAINVARQHVDTEFFCFVDDDDSLIPNTLKHRLAPFENDSEIDVVASNGYRHSKDTGNKAFFKNFLNNSENPLLSLMSGNWLASCGGLYKTSTIGNEFFDSEQKYYEWTYVAFKVALSRKVNFVDLPTFIVNESEGSLSASENYMTELPRFLGRLAAEAKDNAVIYRILKERLARANISVASYYRDRGELKKAISFYYQCLFIIPQGLKYIPWIKSYFKKIFIK